MSAFGLYLKSTLDYELKKLGDLNGWDYFNLDGGPGIAADAESENPAIVFGGFNITPYPRAPQHQVVFDVRAKTSNDPTQYLSMQITAALQTLFSIHASFDIYDYSQATVSVDKKGFIICSAMTLLAPIDDRIANLRPVQVTASAFEFM